tara:strand:- start:1168 stop:1404 length:237 start_codon:yes stop_codon:yes gene_type:complete
MWKSKTLWASLVSLIGVAASVATNEITVAEGLQVAVTAILAIFLRHGISKSQVAAEAAVEAASSISPAPTKKAVKKAS